MPMITVAMYNDKLSYDRKGRVDEAISKDVSKDVKSLRKEVFYVLSNN